MMGGRGTLQGFVLLLAAGALEGCGGCSGTISVSSRDADADSPRDGTEELRDAMDGADVPLEDAEAAEEEAGQDTPDAMEEEICTRDGAGVLWEFIEVLTSGAPTLTPPSDGAGGSPPCASDNVGACTPCVHGGTCGWIQNLFLRSL